MDVTITKFNTTVNELMTTAEKKAKKEEELANLELLRRRIGLLKRTMGCDYLCKEALPAFIKYRGYITTRDDSFFLSLNVKEECGKVKKEDEFIFSLIEQLKNYYLVASVNEKTKLWDRVNLLFELSLEYDVKE